MYLGQLTLLMIFRLLIKKSILRKDIDYDNQFHCLGCVVFVLLGKSRFICLQSAKRQLATVQMLGQHRPDATLIWICMKRIMERWLHSSPSGRSMTPSERRLKKFESVAI